MKKYRFKIGDDGLARAWVSLRFKDKTILSRCLIDTGANVVAVSSALALTLNLPKLGKATSGTAAEATQVVRTMIDEVSVISEDLSEVMLRRENVEALIMRLPVPIVLSGLFLRVDS
ncbi:hypothetical protein DRO59_07635 [Candidatus Bathyarchaeota archaeon]|nr:MAG: hypothetical protein DRO59_07635 [Candidatus Bathyarchaeota archaeon]